MNESTVQWTALGILGVTLIMTLVNAWNITGLTALTLAAPATSGIVSNGSTSSPSTAPTQNSITAADLERVLPKGIPGIYGAELGVSFSDVSAQNPALANATIQKMATLDESITLNADEMNRYIPITNSISCEYCCGVPAITDQQGNAACGCAHSYAMRGLAKYLITRHGSEYSDEQILEELGKWKSLFFPSASVQKANALNQNGIEFNYINLASNKYRGLEQQTQGGNMVGGC